MHVEEKIDGANAQIWMSEGKICCGSRNNTLCTDVLNPPEGTNYFDGFVNWCAEKEELKELFKQNPNMRLYGEWLVKHTIHYNELAYKQFYLFDITTIDKKERTEFEHEEFLSRDEMWTVSKEFNITTPNYHGMFKNPTLDRLMEFVGQSVLGEQGEGITIKNLEFRDKFGNQTYAKIVTEKFKENNGITFGGNNKHSDTYWEMYIANKYITLARVEKVMKKLQPLIDKRLDLEHIPRVANTVYHDMITEEIWEISKKAQAVDFKVLSRVCTKKCIQIYKDILLGTISVADKK